MEAIEKHKSKGTEQMIISTLAFTAAGAALYRWRGMASSKKKYFPRPFNQLAFALPYALVCTPPYVDTWWVFPIVLLLTWAAVLTGHGGWMDLGSWKEEREPERMEFLISWLRGKISERTYDIIGMALNGVLITAPAGITLGNPILALSGALKAPAYIIGWRLKWGTAGGEWLTGGLLWGSLALVFTNL